jgi:hypothetical protein
MLANVQPRIIRNRRTQPPQAGSDISHPIVTASRRGHHPNLPAGENPQDGQNALRTAFVHLSAQAWATMGLKSAFFPVV